jgi:hypothetical protein
MTDSLSTLDATTPPKTKIRFLNIISAHREIERLESRVSKLETLLIAKNSETVVPVATPVALEKTGRERFVNSFKPSGQETPANAAPVKKDNSKLTGREKFAANVKISKQ